MRCRDVQDNLDRYVRGEVTPQVREQMQLHLKDCEVCLAEFVCLQRLETLLAAAPLPPVPEGFAGRVVASMPHERELGTGRSAWIRRIRPRVGGYLRAGASAAAALAAGLLLGGYLGTDTWQQNSLRSAHEVRDPMAGSPLEHFVEPGGGSLGQAYFALMRGNNS